MILLHHKYDHQYYSVGVYKIVGLDLPIQMLFCISIKQLKVGCLSASLFRTMEVKIYDQHRIYLV